MPKRDTRAEKRMLRGGFAAPDVELPRREISPAVSETALYFSSCAVTAMRVQGE